MLYSAGYGVNSVHVVLSGLPFVHACICCKYGCLHAFAAFLLLCEDVTVI